MTLFISLWISCHSGNCHDSCVLRLGKMILVISTLGSLHHISGTMEARLQERDQIKPESSKSFVLNVKYLHQWDPPLTKGYIYNLYCFGNHREFTG